MCLGERETMNTQVKVQFKYSILLSLILEVFIIVEAFELCGASESILCRPCYFFFFTNFVCEKWQPLRLGCLLYLTSSRRLTNSRKVLGLDTMSVIFMLILPLLWSIDIMSFSILSCLSNDTENILFTRKIWKWNKLILIYKSLIKHFQTSKYIAKAFLGGLIRQLRNSEPCFKLFCSPHW